LLSDVEPLTLNGPNNVRVGSSHASCGKGSPHQGGIFQGIAAVAALTFTTIYGISHPLESSRSGINGSGSQSLAFSQG
jgi:hypothetical protein